MEIRESSRDLYNHSLENMIETYGKQRIKFTFAYLRYLIKLLNGEGIRLHTNICQSYVKNQQFL